MARRSWSVLSKFETIRFSPSVFSRSLITFGSQRGFRCLCRRVATSHTLAHHNPVLASQWQSARLAASLSSYGTLRYNRRLILRWMGVRYQKGRRDCRAARVSWYREGYRATKERDTSLPHSDESVLFACSFALLPSLSIATYHRNVQGILCSHSLLRRRHTLEKCYEKGEAS